MQIWKTKSGEHAYMPVKDNGEWACVDMRGFTHNGWHTNIEDCRKSLIPGGELDMPYSIKDVSPLELCTEVLGSQAKLAGVLGISRQAPRQWAKGFIPERYHDMVIEHTGLSMRELLRGSKRWSVSW